MFPESSYFGPIRDFMMLVLFIGKIALYEKWSKNRVELHYIICETDNDM